MSESIRKELDWADRSQDSAAGDAEYEKTYRDGSAMNECWAGDDKKIEKRACNLPRRMIK